MTESKTTAKRKGAPAKSATNVWTDEERAAMQESARERKARRGSVDERAEGEREVRAKISEMPEPDRGMAERIHAIVAERAPAFVPRTYYGMPAYSRDGKTICFFKPASKFKDRYSTFGFETAARIDDGEMWPVAFALTQLTVEGEARIAELVKKAAS
jgi:uncharacterized protein YdhG (YjbR/CyaY superfamily)